MNHTLTPLSPTLARVEEAPFQLLDPRAPGGVVSHESRPLGVFAATISAGYKEKNAVAPTIVRDGKIQLHEDMGEAPGIREALKQTGHKHLTITMLSDDINKCLLQLFCSYGNTKIFGNQHAVTAMWMKDGTQRREVITKDDPKFAATIALCKVSTFVPFMLAEWTEDGEPKVVFPDGFLPYRLRFTSSNAARGFADTLQAIKRLTGGKLVGVPLHLSILYPEKMTPELKRQKVPVWTAVLKHPTIKSLGASDINRILVAGIRDAAQLSLPPAISALPEHVLEGIYEQDRALEVDEETGEVTQNLSREGGEGERIARQIKTAVEGSAAETRIADYFRACQGTRYVDDGNRARLVDSMAIQCGLVLDAPSLKELAEKATAEEWAICTEVMCKAVAAFHGTEPTKAAKPTAADEKNPFGAETAVVIPPTAESENPTLSRDETPTPDADLTSERAGQGSESQKSPPDYIQLDRIPTQDEVERAKAFAAKTMTPQEQEALKRAAGAIPVAFVLLEAERRGLTNLVDVHALVNSDYLADEQPQLM